MELKQLNKIVILLALAICMNTFSQTKIADIENKEFSVNSKTEKRNLIKIFDDSNYSIYYILDRRDFDLEIGSGVSGTANVIFFSKKYNKGILSILRQGIYREKKSIYNVSLFTGSQDKYMFVSSMAILDKDFNYEYFMKYYYLPPPPPNKGDYSSWITIQDTKNYCNKIRIDLKGNVIYENIDDILSNISKVPVDEKRKDCNCIIYNMDLNEFFPKKILK